MSDTAITIQLNGRPHPLPAPATLAELLETLGLSGKPVVVELDLEAVFPRDFSATTVRDGSRVEIVTLAAGG